MLVAEENIDKIKSILSNRFIRYFSCPLFILKIFKNKREKLMIKVFQIVLRYLKLGLKFIVTRIFLFWMIIYIYPV